MDKIHDELDEVKLEAEKLRDECRAKTELYHILKKAQADQLAKSQQDKLEIDKLSRELNAKSDEISEIRQMYEELQSSLQKKDLFLQQISSSNENLRLEHSEKISKLENENRDLVSSLDEASSRIRDLEEKTRVSSDEIAALKRLLSVKTETGFQEEVQKKASRDLKQRDEYILKLEEENRFFQEKLKWKNEQFFHLEEAHGRVRAHFEASKVEWENEKSLFVNEISNLQVNLDAQVRVSEHLETQLKLSNRALVQEESRRKVVEIELSESRARFENLVLDCQVAKSEMEELTVKRDEEIAELRMLLRKKERVENEMNYKTEQLERENSDLLLSLKDIREAQINSNATSCSLKKLRSKLEGLEKLHSKCGVKLKENDDRWNSEREKFTVALRNCASELDCKNKCIRELHEEVEVKNEEMSILTMVLKSEFEFANSKLKVEFSQIEEKNASLNQQLQTKNDELHKVHDERAVLLERVEYLVSLRQKNDVVEDELRRYKAMLDESNEYKNQLLESEKALEMVNIELANRISEVEKSKSDAEIMKLNLEENQKAFEQEKVGLVATVNVKKGEIGKLQEQICQLESAILAKSEIEDQKIRFSEKEAENKKLLLSNIEEKDQEIQELQKEFEEKVQIVLDLEKEVNCLQKEVIFQGKSNNQLKQDVLQLEASLQTKASEIEELKIQLVMHESDKLAFLEDLRKASADKEDLLAQLEGICGRIGILCGADVELVGMLGKMLHVSEENGESARNMVSSDGLDDNITFSPLKKLIQVTLDERAPRTELNC